MAQFISFIDAANELLRLFNRDELPDRLAKVYAGLLETKAMPVDLMVAIIEAIYAYRDDEDMTPEIKQLGADMAVIATMHNFYNMQEDARGDKIALLLRGASLPDGVEVPEAKEPVLPQETSAEMPTSPERPVIGNAAAEEKGDEEDSADAGTTE